jgi:hypothetical protein
MRARPCLAVSACGLLGALAVAQAPPAWTALPVPTGTANGTTTSIGKLVVYRDGPQVHVYSAFTRRWHATAANPVASLRITNDCLLLQDGATWTAFASHGGAFRTLAVSPTAQLLNPAGRDNDSVLLVLDGNLLHAFSGFTGDWSTRSVSNAAGLSVQRHVAMLSDGNLLSGYDAFSGTWHDVAVGGAVLTLSTDGIAGVAATSTTLHGFSALHGTWTTAPALANASLVRNDDWAVWYDPTTMVGYSGVQGTFATASLTASTVAASEDDLALFATNAGIVAFSAIRGTWSQPIAPTTARVRANVASALLVDGPAQQVHGYSAITGTVATTTLDSSFEEVASSVAYALQVGTGQPFLFSGLTGQWYAAPADVLPTIPVLTTTAALLPTNTGLRAFSGRTGAFVPLVAAGLQPVGNSSSSPAAAWNATDLYAFDARSDRWSAQPRSGTGTVTMQIWRTGLFALDGTGVAGFGSQSGQWDVMALPSPLLGSRANSECNRIDLANHVFAHSALAELVSLHQFPEFRRVFATGATMRLQLPLPSGDFALLAAGFFAGTPVPLPGLGALVLQPASLTTSLLLPRPGEHRARIEFAVPPSPWLVGVEFGLQALVVPAAGSAWLSRAAGVLIL